MLTRAKTGKSKPKAFIVHTKSEPTNVKQALTKPEGVKAMRDEFHALQESKIWTLTIYPPDRKLVGRK